MALSIQTAPIKYKDPTTGNFVEIVGVQGPAGVAGSSIASIAKTSTSGLVDTYTITFDNNNTTTFTVTNGSSISTIEKTNTSGLVDTYTVTLSNGSTSTFTVVNGQTPNISMGTVTEGATAAASFSGTASNLALNLTLPQADTSHIIEVQDTQPSATNNKIWLMETAPEATYVPTQTEFIAAESMIAPVESSLTSASKAYAIGDLFIYNNKLYKVTAAVTSGSTISNYTETTIDKLFIKLYTLTVTAVTQDNVTVTGQTVTVREGGASGQIYATASYSGQPVSFALPSGFSYYVSITSNLAHHFNPSTATGIITNTNQAVTLTYSDFSSIHSAADIKAALNAGIDLTDLVGEQITCSKGSDTLTWDVVDYDSTNKSIMILLHDAFGSADMIFEPQQALMWCENGLAAGNYSFIDGSTTYYFTLTTAIPVEGQLKANATTFSTYESQNATAVLETGIVSTTEISGAINLGTAGQGSLNALSRINYGSNNYGESALLWWLNSDAAANTLRTPITKFSRAYSYSVAGFLNGLDNNFINCLDNKVWLCSANYSYECPSSLGGITAKGQTYTVTKKIGLASEMEIFGSYSGVTDGSVVFDLYNGAQASDRIKYRETTAKTWWLRSPHWGYSASEGGVASSGGASVGTAYGSCAVVPAAQISKDGD